MSRDTPRVLHVRPSRVPLRKRVTDGLGQTTGIRGKKPRARGSVRDERNDKAGEGLYGGASGGRRFLSLTFRG